MTHNVRNTSKLKCFWLRISADYDRYLHVLLCLFEKDIQMLFKKKLAFSCLWSKKVHISSPTPPKKQQKSYVFLKVAIGLLKINLNVLFHYSCYV